MAMAHSLKRGNKYCSVPQCTNYWKNGDLSFHTFPINVDLKKKWVHVLRIGKPVSKYMTVCGEHFQRSDYILPDVPTKRRTLKKGTIPSSKLPRGSFSLSKNSPLKKARAARALARQKKDSNCLASLRGLKAIANSSSSAILAEPPSTSFNDSLCKKVPYTFNDEWNEPIHPDTTQTSSASGSIPEEPPPQHDDELSNGFCFQFPSRNHESNRMMDGNKEFLINCVRDVRAIWDKDHPHHHNVHILAKHWKVIAAKVGKSGKEVKTMWKNLRQEFGRQWRKSIHSEKTTSEEVVCTWPFYDAMDFLTGQFKPRKITVSMDSLRDDNQNSEDPVSEDEMSCPPPQSPALPSPLSPAMPGSVPSPLSHSSTSASGFLQRTQQAVLREDVISFKKEKLDLRQSKMTEREDDNLLFLKSLAPQMRKFDPQRNMLFRTEMQGRLYQLLYNDQQVSPPYSNSQDTFSLVKVPQYHQQRSPADNSFSLTNSVNV